MRTSVIALSFLVPLAFSSSATAVPSGPAVQSEGLTQLAQYREESRYCRRLRRACEYKAERGEMGEGNCRRYRRECR
jgi:hypothetical protein